MPGNLDKLLSSASSVLNTDEPALSGELENLAGSLLEDMLKSFTMFVTSRRAIQWTSSSRNTALINLSLEEMIHQFLRRDNYVD